MTELPSDSATHLNSAKVSTTVTSKKAWTISVAASVLLVAGVVGMLFFSGYRFFVVETPSMATTAPVGTLVITRPQASYAIGDVVSYQSKTRVYTHRIVAETPQGWTTKGDLNGATDPLPVKNSQIIGAVVFYGKYIGFFVRGLPWVLLGWLVVYLITLLPRVRPSWRWQIRLFGGSLVVSLVTLWLRPWVNVLMTGYVPADVGVDMHLVNTGIFPVNVLGTILQSGQDAVVNQTVAAADGKYYVTPTLALNAGWFLAMLAICLTPMVIALFVRPEADVEELEAVEDEQPEPAEEPVSPWRRHREYGWIALAALATVIGVSLVLQFSTNAAFASQITNSNNSLGTRTWFSCSNAETGTSGVRFVWDLTSNANQTDQSGNSRTGTRYGSRPTVSTSSPCPNDSTQRSLQFNGATCYTQANALTENETYSMELWFNTTDTSNNGKLIGFGDSTQVSDTHYDRHVYIDPTGRVVFGVWPGQQMVVSSPAGKNYADGTWHHMVATSAPGKISLYLDGSLVGSRSDTAGQDQYNGYWKVGCGVLAQWQDATGVARPFASYYTGNLARVAVYDVTLTATQVSEHYIAGTA